MINAGGLARLRPPQPDLLTRSQEESVQPAALQLRWVGRSVGVRSQAGGERADRGERDVVTDMAAGPGDLPRERSLIIWIRTLDRF